MVPFARHANGRLRIASQNASVDADEEWVFEVLGCTAPVVNLAAPESEELKHATFVKNVYKRATHHLARRNRALKEALFAKVKCTKCNGQMTEPSPSGNSCSIQTCTAAAARSCKASGCDYHLCEQHIKEDSLQQPSLGSADPGVGDRQEPL